MPDEIQDSLSSVEKINYKDLMLNEYKKCAVNPEYFIANYVYIQTTEGRGLFKLFEFQKKLLNILHTRDRVIILKSRQMGITTVSSAYALWCMLFAQDYVVLALAPDQDKSKEIINKITFAYDNLQPWMIKMCKGESVEKNKFSIKLKNGSRAIAASGASKSARGKTANLLILDEVAFIEKADELFASAQQTLSGTNSKAVLLSCVTKDTYVYTDKGIKKIENFYKNPEEFIDYTIPNYNILGKDKLRKGNLFHNNGLTPTKFVNSVYGYLEGSFNHKVYAFSSRDNKYGWYRLDQLNIGDYLSIQYGMNVWGNNNDTSDFKPSVSPKIKNVYKPNYIDENIAYIIGLYISEGSSYINKNINGDVVGGTITLTCGDDLSQSILNIGLPYSSYDKLHYTISSKNFIEFFQYLGFDLSKRAKEKIIPEKVLEMTKDNIIQLLRGIFDGDGSVMKRKEGLRVSIGLSSKELILQLRVLLLNFGVLSTYQEKLTKITKKVKVRSQSYRLDIDGTQAYKFCELIGFNFSRKIDIYEERLNIIGNKRKANPTDLILDYKFILSKIHKNSNLSVADLERKCGIILSSILNKRKNYPNFTRHNALKIKKHLFEFFDNEIDEFYNNNINENIIWSKITNITDKENYTYDFSLPDTGNEWDHSVIYNGIIGHQTPNGVGNFFHSTWIKAEIGESDFVPIKLPWNLHPGRDERWRKKQDEELGVRLASQETECSFLNSGDGYFDADDVQYYKDCFENPIEMTGPNKDYWIWEHVDYTKNYMITVDTSRGDGNDFNTMQVIDVFTGNQVAEYKGGMDLKHFPDFIVSEAIKYNRALVVIENVGIGQTTVVGVQNTGYTNIYYSPKGGTNDVHKYMYSDPMMEPDKFTPGFTTSTITRPQMLLVFKGHVHDRDIKIRSKRLASEMSTFVWKNGKEQAQSGYNDDLIMPYAMGMYLRNTAMNQADKGVAMSKALLSGVRGSSMLPMSSGGVTNGRNPYEHDMGYGNEDIRWLLD